MNLYIREHDDYRSGTDVSVFDIDGLKDYYFSDESDESNDDLTTDERFKERLDMDEDLYDVITINDIPNDTYAVYLICGEGYYEKTNITHIINQETDSDEILNHLYSDINGHQSFVSTGYTSSYKETGYYPDALPKYFINDEPLINEEIQRALDDIHNYIVAVIIKDQKLINYIQISPRG
jgi:hypothetical protein